MLHALGGRRISDTRYHMSVFVCMRIGLHNCSQVILGFFLCLFCLHCSLLTLCLRILLRLEHALPLLGLFQLKLFFGISLLLLQSLLGCRGRFSPELGKLFFFVCQFLLSFLLLEKCLHLSRLHRTASNIREH